MRIISGKFKGRLFTVPKNFAGRPTTDFAREGLFNMLGATLNFSGLATLDLFSGTGAFSLECHSRGASRIQAVELNALHVKFIQQNFKDFEANAAKALKADVKSFLNKPATETYDLVFADPPFDLEWLPSLPDMVLQSGVLAPDALFILEHPKEHTFESHPQFEKHRAYGHVHFSFFRP
jgi:16S rRNA (guanine966-N2)-methyltransferase